MYIYVYICIYMHIYIYIYILTLFLVCGIRWPANSREQLPGTEADDVWTAGDLDETDNQTENRDLGLRGLETRGVQGLGFKAMALGFRGLGFGV